jgi:hypothetical protein
MQKDQYPLVEIKRNIDNSLRRGFIVLEGKSLVVLHQVDSNFRLDGYCIIRRDDIASSSESFEKRRLVSLALHLKKQTPKPPAQVQLSSMRHAMETAQNEFGILVIHREKVSLGDVEIGSLRLSTDSTYVLRWLTPTAIWETDDRPFRYRDVTFLEFGMEYEQTLLAVANIGEIADEEKN